MLDHQRARAMVQPRSVVTAGFATPSFAWPQSTRGPDSKPAWVARATGNETSKAAKSVKCKAILQPPKSPKWYLYYTYVCAYIYIPINILKILCIYMCIYIIVYIAQMRCKAQDLLEELAADALRHLGHRKCRCCHQHRPQSLDRRWGMLRVGSPVLLNRDGTGWEVQEMWILLAMCAREHVAVELQQTFSIDMVMRHRETWHGRSPCQLCKTKIIGAIWTQQSMMYVKPRLLNPEWWILEAKPNQWEIAGSR